MANLVTLQQYKDFAGLQGVKTDARINTIMKNQGLGSGYSVSLKDLKLRGAGDLFGCNQWLAIRPICNPCCTITDFTCTWSIT